MSPGPSEVDKALIQKLEVQNFQNASDNSQRLQQKLVNEKKHEIDQRNKAEEQNRKNKFRVSFIFSVILNLVNVEMTVEMGSTDESVDYNL